MRSEEFIPHELRQWLQPPRLSYVLTGLGLAVALGICAVGIHKMSDARLVPGTTRLTEVEQERVARMLLSEGLSQYRFADGVLMVPHGERAEYLQVIRTISVGPRAPGSSLRRVDGMSPFLAREERLRRIQVAEGEMVADHLRAIHGIDEVYVNFDEALIGGLHQKREIKAAVAIRPTAGDLIDAQLLASIRRIVAGYKAGLVEANVTVLNIRTGVSYDGSVMPMSTASQKLAIEKATMEQHWQENVSRVLQFIPGAKVETTIDIGSGNDSLEELSSIHRTRLAVAVSVPVSYYHSLWAQNSKATAGGFPDSSEIAALENQTREKIESLVMGLNSTGNDAPSLNVAVFQELNTTNPTLAYGNSPVVSWFQRNSNKFMQGLTVLLAVGLVYFAFRDLFFEDVEDDEDVDSAAKSNGIRVAPETSLELASGSTLNSGERTARATPDETDFEPVGNSSERIEKSFVNAELTDLVREHPQAASAMLKSWVEKAG